MNGSKALVAPLYVACLYIYKGITRVDFSHATEASRRRREIALDLAETCPLNLGQEIALTGSVARGVADEDSDIEVLCWTDMSEVEEPYLEWLRAAGATEIVGTGCYDGTAWITCRYRDIWAEVGWTQIAPFGEMVRRIAAGEDYAYARLEVAAAVARAVPLRTGGLLAQWQAALHHYPESTRAAIIRANTAAWSDPHVPPVRWTLAWRDQRMSLAMRLTWDMQNLLNVLWAINRRWPEDWKWTDDRSLNLTIAPTNLSERINRVFTFDPPEAAIRTAFELIEETLLLVPLEYDVTAALASIRDALRNESPLSRMRRKR